MCLESAPAESKSCVSSGAGSAGCGVSELETLHPVAPRSLLARGRDLSSRPSFTQGGGGAFSPLKKQQLRAENDFVRFDTPFLPKPLFFRKAKGSATAASAPRAVQVRELSPIRLPPTSPWPHSPFLPESHAPGHCALGLGPHCRPPEPGSAMLGVPRLGVELGVPRPGVELGVWPPPGSVNLSVSGLGWPEGGPFLTEGFPGTAQSERLHHCCLPPFVILPSQRDKTPSSSKKVTFGLNRNMTAGECGGHRP